jgi:hypothetical protein
MRRSLLVLSAAALFIVAADASSSANTSAAVFTVAAPAPDPSPASSPSPSPRTEAVAAPLESPLHPTAAKLAPADPRTAKLLAPAAPAAPSTARLVSGSRDACVMSVPVSGDPASFLATAKRALGAKGGSVSGTTSAGSFSVPAPLGAVDGTYALEGAAARITIAPASLGFVQSCSKVYGALTTALAR